MDLIFLNYNNYYNRIVKRPLPTLQNYLDDGAEVVSELYSVINFNPNNGVSTIQTVNSLTSCDYVLCFDEFGIASRWFVIGLSRNRLGQYQAELYRDLIADYWVETTTAPMFVKRALVSLGDPAIYNEENIAVNQILTRKDLLKDETECPWIIGYIPKNYPEQSQTIQFNYTPSPDITVTSIEDWEHYINLSKNYWAEDQTLYAEANYSWSGAANNFKAGITLAMSSRGTIEAIPPTNANSWENFQFESPIYTGNIEGQADGVSTGNPRNFKEKLAEQIAGLNANTCYNYAKAFIGVPNIDPALEALVNKIVFDTSTNTTYRVVRKRQSVYYSQDYTSLSGPLWQALNPVFNIRPDNFTNLSTTFFHLVGPYNIIKYELSTLGAEGEVTFTSNRTHLIDQPYDMFAMPYSDDIYLGIDNTAALKFSKAIAMGFAQQLAANIGSTAVFDVQILPYCPVKDLLYVDQSGRKMINFKETAATAITTIPDSEGRSTQIGALFWCASSQFSFEIPYYIDLPNSSVSRKLMSVCDKYRLCSPNMASFFDFDPVKNNGVGAIEVDCYYKPFNPYIHLNPRFGGLYGGMTGYEVRGLDLGGNFSLTQTSDAWTDYQLQNKNFQEIFNRQVENMEVSRKYERINQALSGSVSALGTGVTTGVALGNVYAGVAAGVTSGAAAVSDYFISEKLYKEQLSFTKDNFEYALDNIRALPQTLTRVDALSPNNALFPYIEFYTCSAIERQAVIDKITYNGMTVGRIGTVQEFLQPSSSFIQGELIRIEGVLTPEQTNNIAKEFRLGVYL